jgi:hypothetical protein
LLRRGEVITEEKAVAEWREEHGLTPEVFGGQEPGGPEASTFTTEQLEGEQVALEFDEETVDRFGRALAYVWLPGGELFNETLVRQGYAEVATFEPNVKYEARFEAAEEEARAEGLGIWGSGSEETTSGPTTPSTSTPPTPPAPPPPPPLEPNPGTLMKAGGSTTGPVAKMPGGLCPEEFPEPRGGACYAA